MHVIFARYRVRPAWSPEIARVLLGQGLPIAGTLLLATLTMNADYLVVGRMLGATTLGFYLMAFNLSTSPVKLFSTAVASVALPGFAKLQGDLTALRTGFVQSLTWLMWVTIPVGVGLSIAATTLCTFVYGSRWAPAGAALRFLALVGIMRVALQLGSDLLVAVGRSRSTLWLQGLWLATLLPAVIIGAHVAGIKGVGVAHLLVAAGVMIPAYLVAVRAVGLRARDFAPTLAGPIVGGLAAVVVGSVLVTHIDHELPVLLLAGALALLGPLLPVHRQLRALAGEAMTRRKARRADQQPPGDPTDGVGAVALAESWES
jgi:O-antigen/teichoic acid export membrane protein